MRYSSCKRTCKNVHRDVSNPQLFKCKSVFCVSFSLCQTVTDTRSFCLASLLIYPPCSVCVWGRWCCKSWCFCVFIFCVCKCGCDFSVCVCVWHSLRADKPVLSLLNRRMARPSPLDITPVLRAKGEQ